MEIVGRTVPRHRLTPLWAQRMFWGGLLSAVAALAVRRVLALEPLGLRFALLFGGALVLAATGWTLFAQIREPAHPPAPMPGTSLDLLRRGFVLLRSDTPFRRVLIARTVLNVWLAASPFMVLFAVRDLGGQVRAAGTMLVARIAGFVLGNLLWQPLARAHGNRAVMIVGTLGAGALGLAAAAVAIASPWHFGWLAGGQAVLLLELLAFVGGAVHSSLSVGFASLSIELAPPGQRLAFVSLVNTFLGPTLLLPMLGGLLLDRTSAPLLFAACGVLALLGARAAFGLPRPEELASAALPVFPEAPQP
jgi:Na+/melibiose symporter-like transporter